MEICLLLLRSLVACVCGYRGRLFYNGSFHERKMLMETGRASVHESPSFVRG